MLFLGFSAGLPMLLVAGTLMAWLKDSGIELATIGFLSWVGMAHSVKILLAPIVDRISLPFLTKKLGRRRSWMLFSQLSIFFALLGMASTEPKEGLLIIAICAVLTGTASAVQDIAIDAYRIEAAEKEFQAAMAASYVLGYRIAILVSGAGALHFAQMDSWASSYYMMARFAWVGIVTTLIIKEPESSKEVRLIFLGGKDKVPNSVKIKFFLEEAILAPFLDFWNRYGKQALLILVFISIFKISDIFMGVMANPFYLDIGFTKEQIANVTAVFGMAMTLLGAGFGGILVARFGIGRMLLFSAFFIPLTNLAFSLLALIGPDIRFLFLTIIADNIASGMAASVFIAYLSSLTSKAYTATQYALFSSLMMLPGQFLAGFTGTLAAKIGWVKFFILASCVGIPTILLAFCVLVYVNPDKPSSLDKGQNEKDSSDEIA